MKRECCFSCVVLVALVLAAAADARAQSRGATISGTVRDAAGRALAGVTVEASGEALGGEKRSVITDREGAYTLADLPEGQYVVGFALTGFRPLVRSGINVARSSTATIDVVMHSGAEQAFARTAVTSREVMDTVPSDRTFISYAAMTPGMQVVGGGGLQNVGGSLPENSLMLQIHGSRINESRLFVDGMSVMSGLSTGGVGYGNFLNNAMAEQIVVHTGSLSAEFELGGVTSNIITRQGTNVFRGFLEGRYTNTSFQGRNLTADLIARGLTSANRIKRIWDFNPSAGGPLVRNRAWLFSSVRHWGTYNYIAGLYDDLDPTALFYTPDPARSAVYPVWHASADARLTMRPTPANRIDLTAHQQLSDFGTCTSPAPTRLTAPSACAHNKNDPQWFVQASWVATLSRRTMVEAGWTITAQKAVGHREPGAPVDLPSITESSTRFMWRAPADGFGGTRNSQSNYRAAVMYSTRAHTAKAGLTLMHQWRITGSEHNGSVNYTFFNSEPNRVTQFAEPATFHERVNYNLGLYVQDRWAVGRLTLDLGARADFLNSQVDAQDLPEGRLIGARTFAAIHDVPNWQDVSPRLGAAYDLFGNGRTEIKATLSRYVEGESYTIAREVNPLQSTVSNASRSWDDKFYPDGDARRGNFVPDCDLTIVEANGECGAANPNTFGQTIVRTKYDTAVTQGFGVRPYNWEASLSVQHELLPRVSVYAGYFRRSYGNFSSVRQNLAVSNADFSPYCITVPLDPLVPGSGSPMCGFFDVSVQKFGEANTLVTRAENFGKQEDVFDGFDFTVAARLPKQGLVNGGLSLGRKRTKNCYTTADLSLAFAPTGATAPRTQPFCDVHPPMQPNLKVQGSYPLPWWGLLTAATFQSLTGPQIFAQRQTANAEILPSLHRNLASCGVRATCNATVLLDLLAPGTLYGDRVYQVDFRISRSMKVGRTRVRPTLSIYNLLNANPVLRYDNTYGRTWRAPLAILTARFADIGVRVEF